MPADGGVSQVAPSNARTSSGSSAAMRTPTSANALAVLLKVTAVSGVLPTLTVSVEWSQDGVTFAAADPADQFNVIIAAGSKVKRFDVKGDFFRVVWTIGGTTPSFTFGASSYGI